MFLIGCSPRSSEIQGDEPPAITAGVDLTYPDGRVIEDLRYAAVYRAAGAEIRRFDDIGRMMTFLSQETEPVSIYWVFDFDKAEPVNADTAYYIASPKLVTPRGSGIIAVADPERAAQLARENGGRVLGWEELDDYLAAVPEIPIMPATSGGGLGGLLEADR